MNVNVLNERLIYMYHKTPEHSLKNQFVDFVLV